MDDKKKTTEPEFHLYEVKAEAMVPAKLTFRVRAQTPEQALLLIEKQNPTGFYPILARRKIKEAKVYYAGTLHIVSSKIYR